MLTTFFGEEHEIFRKTLREWVQKELVPHVAEWEEAELFDRTVFNKAGEMGCLGASYREDVGGSGGDWWYTVVWGEELVRSGCAGVNMALAVQSTMATPIINEIGTRYHKDEFLVPALKGEKIAALGVSEPNCGPDVAAVRTTARTVGDAHNL